MYEDTPNKEEIDWIESRIQEIYDYDRLKDCDAGYLNNKEDGVRNYIWLVEHIFPGDDSVQDTRLKEIIQGQNIDRDKLTSPERIRLLMLRREAEVEIHRAKGHRKKLRREQRNKLANALSDMVKSIVSLIFR